MPWTAEEAAALAKEGGIASGEARRRKSKTAPERAIEAAGRNAASLLEDLLAAAKGEGDFKDLPSKLRLTALMRYLEYGLGRPTSAAQRPTENGEPEPSGLQING